jgi:CHAT domain-containing protein
VLYTADDVDDEVAADLTTAFYAALAEREPVAAFAHALTELALRRTHPGGLLAFRLTGLEP